MKRKKTLALHVYIDESYQDKVDYIRDTCGITRFVEQSIDRVKIDEKLWMQLKQIKTAT